MKISKVMGKAAFVTYEESKSNPSLGFLFLSLPDIWQLALE
jgi:hypothetical protein